MPLRLTTLRLKAVCQLLGCRWAHMPCWAGSRGSTGSARGSQVSLPCPCTPLTQCSSWGPDDARPARGSPRGAPCSTQEVWQDSGLALLCPVQAQGTWLSEWPVSRPASSFHWLLSCASPSTRHPAPRWRQPSAPTTGQSRWPWLQAPRGGPPAPPHSCEGRAEQRGQRSPGSVQEDASPGPGLIFTGLGVA